MSIEAGPMRPIFIGLCLMAAGGAPGAETMLVHRPTPSAAWAETVAEDLSRQEYGFADAGDGIWSAPNRAHDLRTRISGQGVHVLPRMGSTTNPAGWDFRMMLESWGRGDRMHPVAAAILRADGERIVLRRGPIEEWYQNDERGVEQGFDLATPPPGTARMGDVRIRLSLSGSLLAYPAGDAAILLRDGDGRDLLRIDRLQVDDAVGRSLPARFRLLAGAMEILFDDSEAVYPVTVDPTIGSSLWAVSGDQLDDDFGTALSTAGDVNGDGYSDFLVGAALYDSGQNNEGMAFLYLGGPSGPSSLAAWSYQSDQAEAYLGRSVASAGDVNGDGFDDVIIGAPYWDHELVDEGAAWVFLGSASGLSATPAWRGEGDRAGAGFGFSVSGGGDLNGDDLADIIVGAPFWSNGQTNEGAILAYAGSASGPGVSPLSTVESDFTSGYLGYSVGAAMDVNGDGFEDVIAGMVGYSNGQSGEGGARLYLGSAAGMATTPAWTGEGNQSNAAYGFSVAGAGDTNGDGYADLIVGAPDWDGPGIANEGIAYVYLGNASGASAAPVWSGRIGQPGGAVGWSVATAGDANGDGYADVLVGAPNLDGALADIGAIFVCFGSPAGPEPSAGFWGYGIQAGAQLGRAVATVGDVNGDGLSDIMAGAPGIDTIGGPQNAGLVQLFPGRTSPPAGLSSYLTGGQTGARLGEALAVVGDVNGDGYSDLLVGAYQYDNGQTDEGRVALHYGSATGISGTPGWIMEMNQAGAQFGHALAAAGDVNGDGYADFLVGAFAWDGGQTDEGAVFLFYGSPTGPAASPNWSAEGNQDFAWFGFDVNPAGDVNGDGYADFIIGAPRWSNGQSEEGKAVVYLGSPAGPTGPTWTIEGNQAGAWLGFSASTAGDVNADGLSDIVVGAPKYDVNGASNSGLASVYLGTLTGPAIKSVWDFAMLQPGANLGRDVATVGDFNGDGRSEIAIGIPLDDFAGIDTGSTLIVWGTSTLPAPTYSFLDGAQAGDYFGGRVSTAGDVNGDGYSDLLISAYLYDNGEVDEGKNYLCLGNAAGTLIFATGWQPEGNQAGAQMGVSLAAGDLNGDGFGDVVIGAYLTTVSFVEEGSILVYHGNEGLGRPRRARQAEPDGTRPLQPLAIPQGPAAFRARLQGRSAAGRTRMRMQVEARPLTVPFDATGLTNGATVATGAPAAGGSTVALDELVGGLAAYTPYRWRARTVGRNPYFPRTPWTFIPDNAAGESDLRTRGCRDLDQDGYGSPGDATCPAGAAADCSDLDATSYPGAPEICDGLDNDCDAVIDEVPPPLGASEIEFSTAAPFYYLQWLPDPESTMWDVVRGDLGLLRSGSGNLTTSTAGCEANNTPFVANSIMTDPPPGQGWWYLMRRVNCGGSGTWDSLAPSQSAPRDAGINASPSACP